MRRAYPFAALALAVLLFIVPTACSGETKGTTMIHTAYSPGAFFVTNIRDSNKLLKSELVLTFELVESADKPGSPDAAALKEIEDVNHAIRDCVIELLRDKTEDDLKDYNAMQNIRDELIDELRGRLSLNSLIDIAFTEFVFQ